MKPPAKTLALVALASGMLASAYFIDPAPAATAVLAAPRQVPSLPMAASPSKPASTIKTLKAPVPLLVGRHDQYFDVNSVPDAMPVQGPAIATARADDVFAKTAIEQDGYRGVKNLVKAPDGSWRGRALRGSTEVAVRVDASGSVAAD